MPDLILYLGIKVPGHGSKVHLVAVDVWQCLRLDGQFAENKRNLRHEGVGLAWLAPENLLTVKSKWTKALIV
jgi:hypothetical protein